MVDNPTITIVATNKKSSEIDTHVVNAGDVIAIVDKPNQLPRVIAKPISTNKELASHNAPPIEIRPMEESLRHVRKAWKQVGPTITFPLTGGKGGTVEFNTASFLSASGEYTEQVKPKGIINKRTKITIGGTDFDIAMKPNEVTQKIVAAKRGTLQTPERT